MARLRTAAFAVLLAGVIAANAFVVWVSIFRNPLWEDEAFNLTVPLNLLRGLGYTSDGVLSGSLPTPFDVRISTGPVVLLPIAGVLATGIDPVVGSRLVPAAFFALLLLAVWLLGRRIGGRWAGLVALCVPMVFDASAPPSPIQGPADVLGEVAAAALLAWALYALQRRPWLAGLLLGLAIQTKYISFIAVPAFVIAMLLRPGRVRDRLGSLLAPAAFAVLPTVVIEVVVLLTLGPTAFVEHLRQTRDFLRSGGQIATTTVGEKLLTLADSWRVAPEIVIALVIASVVLGLWAWLLVVRYPALRERIPSLRATAPAPRRGASQEGAPSSDVGRSLLASVEPLVVAVLGAGAFVGWWAVLASHTPLWVRHPSPGLLAFVPVLAAYVVVAIRVVAAKPRVIGVAAGTLFAAVIAVQSWMAVMDAAVRSSFELDEQRVVAADLASFGQERFATVWGRTVSIVVMSDAHAALVDAPPENIEGLLRLRWGDACAEGESLVLTSASHVICEAAAG